MTDADRALIVQNCLQSAEDRIVITHGTDTMTETAAAHRSRHLRENSGAHRRDDSLCLWQLRRPLQSRQRALVCPGVAAGVYIAMNGQCFPGIGSGKIASAANLRRFLQPRLDRQEIVLIAITCHSSLFIESDQVSGGRFLPRRMKTPAANATISMRKTAGPIGKPNPKRPWRIK